MSETLQVFVDIDGVVLYPTASHQGSRGEVRIGGQTLATASEAFFHAITRPGCKPAWLSAWTSTGRKRSVESRLLPFLPKCAKSLRTPRWSNRKTEAICPAQPFIWFDDEYDATWLDGDFKWLESVGASVVRLLTDGDGYVRRTERMNPFSHGMLVVLPSTAENLRLALGEFLWFKDYVRELLEWRRSVAPASEYAADLASKIGHEAECVEPLAPAGGSMAERVSRPVDIKQVGRS